MMLHWFSPLEQFEVLPLASFNISLIDLNLSLTNLGLFGVLVTLLALGVHILTYDQKLLIPTRWTLAIESSYASLNGLVKEQIGSSKEGYFPLIYSLFMFIIFANLLGNIPYTYTITTSAVCSIGLSFTVFFGVTFLALAKHRIKFFSFFVPGGTPLGIVPLLVWIEFISYIARAFSLGVRLFSNIVAGHCLLAILSGFLYAGMTSSIVLFFVTLLPMVLFVALVVLEVAVSFIQAYVFTVLTCNYLKDAIYLH